MLGVFAAGRILNPKTAHSQLIGGMILVFLILFVFLGNIRAALVALIVLAGTNAPAQAQAPAVATANRAGGSRRAARSVGARPPNVVAL